MIDEHHSGPEFTKFEHDIDVPNDGGPAFPNTVYFGMTLLDYFAGKALAGMNWRDSEKTYDEDAEMCYKMAAAMLKERTS